jgi:hypothetical protein
MSLHPDEAQALSERNSTEQQRKAAVSLAFATGQVLSSLEIFEFVSKLADSTEVSEHLTAIEAALGELVMKYNASIECTKESNSQQPEQNGNRINPMGGVCLI